MHPFDILNNNSYFTVEKMHLNFEPSAHRKIYFCLQFRIVKRKDLFSM